VCVGGCGAEGGVTQSAPGGGSGQKDQETKLDPETRGPVSEGVLENLPKDILWGQDVTQGVKTQV